VRVFGLFFLFMRFYLFLQPSTANFHIAQGVSRVRTILGNTSEIINKWKQH